jgi:hypothetical protein
VQCMEDVRQCVAREMESDFKTFLFTSKDDAKETEKSFGKLINWLRKYDPDYPNYVGEKSMLSLHNMEEEKAKLLGSNKIPITNPPESDDEVQILKVIGPNVEAKKFAPKVNPRSGSLVVFDPNDSERDYAEEEETVKMEILEMD